METEQIELKIMDAANQDTFLKKLERALSDVPENLRNTTATVISKQPDAGNIYLENIKQRTRKDQLALLENMIAESGAINLKVVPVKDMAAAGEHIFQLVIAKQSGHGTLKQVVAWKHPLLESLNLENRLKRISVPIFFTEFENHEEKALLMEKIANAFIGVTSAEFCLADSATMVLKTRPGQARSVSLAPSIHVAVILLEQILADLNELYTLLKNDPVHSAEGLTRCLTFITGPSKTADIEAIMVHGVHGPQEVYLYVITA
jgi:L-lactate dehydrogenase complex protein LldG